MTHPRIPEAVIPTDLEGATFVILPEGGREGGSTIEKCRNTHASAMLPENKQLEGVNIALQIAGKVVYVSSFGIAKAAAAAARQE